MGQLDDGKVKGQNLSKMNLIVKRIEVELDQLKNLINEQIHGLTASTTNCDENPDAHENPGDSSIIDDGSYCLVDTLKIENDLITITNENYDYQNEFNEDQDRPSNVSVDELILGGVSFNFEVSSKGGEDQQNQPHSSFCIPFFEDNIVEETNDDDQGMIERQKILKKVEKEAKSQDKLIIQEVPEDLDLDVDSFQISKSNEILDENLKVGAKNDSKLSQKLIVQMGLRCDDKNPLILNSNRAFDSKRKISSSKAKINEKDVKNVDILSKKTKKGPVGKLYICPYCLKYFSNLTYHIRIHTGVRPFKCKMCSKSFIRGTSLKIHSRVHTGEKPFSCTFCSKSFAQLATRDNHIRRHTGEKPHSCSFCSKSFIRSQALNDHIRTHTGERPYSCSTCSETFAQSGHLKDHKEKLHAGEKPFSI